MILKKHVTIQSGMELYDYVEFMLFSRLRVSEQKNVRFRDVEIHETKLAPGQLSSDQQQILYISNIQGKCGLFYGAPTQPEAVAVFRRILKRRNTQNWEYCLKLVGNEIHGKAKLMDTSYGKIAKNILADGVTLGVSIRGVGSFVNGVVQNDYKILAVDLAE